MVLPNADIYSTDATRLVDTIGFARVMWPAITGMFVRCSLLIGLCVHPNTTLIISLLLLLLLTAQHLNKTKSSFLFYSVESLLTPVPRSRCLRAHLVPCGRSKNWKLIFELKHRQRNLGFISFFEKNHLLFFTFNTTKTLPYVWF